MKKLLILISLFSTIALASTGVQNDIGQVVVDPGTGINAFGYPMLGQNGSNFIPLSVDSSGNLNFSGSISIGAVSQGARSGSAQPWLFDLEQYLGSPMSVTNPAAFRISNGTAFVDPTQIRHLDSSTDSVAIAGSITASNPSVSATGSAVPAQATYTGFKSQSGNLVGVQLTAGGALPIDGSGATQPVSGTVAVSNFPATQPVSGTVTANAGTGTFQTNITNSSIPVTQATSPWSVSQSGTWTVQPGNTPNTTPWLSTINQGGNSANVTVGNALMVDGSAVTQPISAASLPLPTGAATAANQSTANTTLSSINTKTPPLGQAVMANSVPVAIASDQSAIPITGSITATNPSVSNTGSSVPAQATQVGGKDGSGNLQAIKVSTGGVVSVDGSAVTQPVSGTVAVSNFPGTQPVSGTVTANIGTTGGLALDSTVSGLQVPQGTSTGGTNGGLIQGAVSTGAPTYSSGTINPVSITPAGSLRVDGSGAIQPISASALPLPAGASTAANQTTANTSLSSIVTNTTGLSTAANQTNGNQQSQIVQGGNIATVTASSALKVDGSGVTQPVSGTVTANQGTSPWVSNVSQFGGSNVLTGTGASGSGVPRVTVSNDSAFMNSGTGSITTNGGTVVVTTNGATSVSFQILGTFSGAVITQCSIDGSTFFACSGVNPATGIVNNGVVSTTGNVTLSTAGYKAVQVIGVFFASGTANISWASTSGANVRYAVNANANPGRGTVTTARNVYSSTNVTTSAFTTLVSSTSSTVNEVNIFDSSGQTLALSWASSCGALTTASNTINIFPGGNGIEHITIPSGDCVGIKAISATASTGEIDVNFLQ